MAQLEVLPDGSHDIARVNWFLAVHCPGDRRCRFPLPQVGVIVPGCLDEAVHLLRPCRGITES